MDQTNICSNCGWKFCSKCGKSSPPDSRFCSKCASPL
ncbi:MAG: zinc-ribbon domain-containing protein [Candidatus Jordarchaeum sp.]